MIVITGAAGFIGSCLLARFNALGRKDIIVIDHLDSPLKKQNLKNKSFVQYYEKGDFLKLVVEDRVDSTIETIIHMGACSSTILQDAKYFQENNFEYSKKLAEWCLAHHVRLIYASSAATYGDGRFGYCDDDESTRRLQPLNLYGESKQRFDVWVLDQGFINRFVGLKFFNVFGPNEYHKGEMRSVIAKAYDRVVQEGKMSLFKSYRKEYAHGEQKRDFVYVKDAVDIIMFFFGRPHLNGIYNVGTGCARTWNDLAYELFSVVGRTPHIEYVEMPEAMRPQYQYFTEADMTKLHEAGYDKPFTSLEDGIRDYAMYLKNHTHL